MGFTTKKRIQLLKLLIQRDGAECRVCGKEGDIDSLTIDHIDNNARNNRHTNFQLLCRSDNTKKNPRGKAGKVNEKIDGMFKARPQSAEMDRNLIAERKFRHWLLDLIREHKKFEMMKIIYGGAEFSGCSTETVKRYLRKVTSFVGLYEEVNGMLQMKKKLTWREKAAREMEESFSVQMNALLKDGLSERKNGMHKKEKVNDGI